MSDAMLKILDDYAVIQKREYKVKKRVIYDNK